MLGKSARQLCDDQRIRNGSDVVIFRNKGTQQEVQFKGRMIQNQEKDGSKRRYYSFAEGTDIVPDDVIQIMGAKDLWIVTETEDQIIGGTFVQLKAVYQKWQPGLVNSKGTPSGIDLTVSKEGAFFKGQYFDALFKIGEIFSHAKTSIDLVDGYVNDKVLNIIGSKAPGTQLRILTFSKSINPGFMAFAAAFKMQHKILEIRTSSAFHDRFILIDGVDLYHIGSSIKDAGSKGFMFSRIEEKFIVSNFISEWTKEWSAAKVEL